MDFITLNIKMTDEQTQSLCAIEIVEVKARRIFFQKSWFFRPDALWISLLCAKRYQLKLSDFLDAPTLPTIWPEIASYLKGKIIFCHKAVWTIPTLLKALEKNQLAYPPCYLGCSLMLSKRLYPHLKNHQINQLASDLNLVAITTLEPTSTEAFLIARLILSISTTLKCFYLDDILQTLQIQLGSINPDRTTQLILPTFRNSCATLSISTHHNKADSEMTNHVTTQLPYDFKNKVIVLTGPLESMPRVDAVKKLHALGAIHTSSVTSKTQVVLTNVKNPEQLPLETLTSKLRRALILKQQGHPIDIIHEETFLNAIRSLKE